ncbi:DUF3168 domain-containing protein [Zavarzinia aquatilis]|uniref:DUF3168 domain-containing protein n=1 Tax=Zavarzinia aquatilis TaxID=2211142 RepID=A0A317E7W3_9PROT|nr:DUF3168 domain-containing protein [Zavarzinia aquatilis]PWR22751.1 DUF3168 domain-containing protein [Zavarzinia aquatilis]
MIPDASLAVQTALFARLAGHAPLSLLIGDRLHDRRPEAGGFPHVVIGEAAVTADDSATRGGQRHEVTLHVWSRYRGRAEAKRILAALADALHRQPLSLAAPHRCVILRVAFSTILDDEDGVTAHGVMRLRVVTEAVDPY